MQLIAVITVVAFLGVGAVIALVATVRKRRMLEELSRSEEFSAVHDSVPEASDEVGEE